jgi:hypothetical protein
MLRRLPAHYPRLPAHCCRLPAHCHRRWWLCLATVKTTHYRRTPGRRWSRSASKTTISFACAAPTQIYGQRRLRIFRRSATSVCRGTRCPDMQVLLDNLCIVVGASPERASGGGGHRKESCPCMRFEEPGIWRHRSPAQFGARYRTTEGPNGAGFGTPLFARAHPSLASRPPGATCGWRQFVARNTRIVALRPEAVTFAPLGAPRRSEPGPYGRYLALLAPMQIPVS